MKKAFNLAKLRNKWFKYNTTVVDREQEKLTKFVEERNRALLSLDKGKILFYMRKYNIPRNDNGDDRIFWSGVHYSITQIASATNEQKEASISWLVTNGFEIPDKVEFTNEEESK